MRKTARFAKPSFVPYLLEDRVVRVPHWLPVMLLPAKAANLDGAPWLMRASERYTQFAIRQAAIEGKSGYRRLTPVPISYTADQFSLGA